ncbi:HAD family hydrolase [Micromonospora sp. CA-263727]|uniref:HAD family hydrolase n=1 Tax=Micromonospora sp. CA-263727 TaxID=3239967 RepID=UPI003D925C56
MPAPEPDVLLVDLGGVLFHYDFHRAINRWATLANVNATLLRERFAIDGPFDAFERGTIAPGEYLAHLRRLLGVDLDDHALTAGWNAIYGPAHHDLVALLRRLDPQRIVPVGVSNTNILHAASWRRRYRQQLTALRAVYCSHEIGHTKPDRAFFTHITSSLGADLDRLIVLDDQPAVITAATAMGLRAHLHRTATGTADFLATLGH